MATLNAGLDIRNIRSVSLDTSARFQLNFSRYIGLAFKDLQKFVSTNLHCQGFKSHSHCFLGSELVTLLVEKYELKSRQEVKNTI
jgi:hypothetical protein